MHFVQVFICVYFIPLYSILLAAVSHNQILVWFAWIRIGSVIDFILISLCSIWLFCRNFQLHRVKLFC